MVKRHIRINMIYLTAFTQREILGIIPKPRVYRIKKIPY